MGARLAGAGLLRPHPAAASSKFKLQKYFVTLASVYQSLEDNYTFVCQRNSRQRIVIPGWELSPSQLSELFIMRILSHSILVAIRI